MKRRLSPAQRKRLYVIAPEIPIGPHDNPLAYFTGYTRDQLVMQAGFHRFDRLPKPVRRRLHELAVTFDPVPIGKWWDESIGQAPYKQRLAYLLKSLRDAEKRDLIAFAHQYRARYGFVLPHVAAQATILRYGQC